MNVPNRDDIEKRLLAVISRGVGASLSSGEFDDLAFEVFSFQYAANPIYRAFCESRGSTPEGLRSAVEIPAVPTEAFKVTALSCGEPHQARAVFRTSGTTAGAEQRGTHYMLDTQLYRAALRTSFRAHLLPEEKRIRIASLIPSPHEAGDSSLSFMIGDVIETFGAEGSEFFIATGLIRFQEFLEFARASSGRAQPVMIVGTSFAFVHLLDTMADKGVHLRLPSGTRVMDTGGFKGRSREISQADLYESIGKRLDVPATQIINEYGMTELSSQMYDGIAGSAPGAGEPRRHRPPPWVRVIAVDPETLEPVEEGTPGILRIHDLANLGSVAAVQTSDLGRVTSDGVELLGRAPQAEARGCSIAMDDLLQVMKEAGPS